MSSDRLRSVLMLVVGIAVGVIIGGPVRGAVAGSKAGKDEVVSIAVGRGGTVYRAWKSGRIDACPDDGSSAGLCRGRVDRGTR